MSNQNNVGARHRLTFASNYGGGGPPAEIDVQIGETIQSIIGRRGLPLNNAYTFRVNRSREVQADYRITDQDTDLRVTAKNVAGYRKLAA